MRRNYFPIDGSPCTDDPHRVWLAISEYLKSRTRQNKAQIFSLLRDILSRMGKTQSEIREKENLLEYKLQMLTLGKPGKTSKVEWLRFLSSFYCESRGSWRIGLLPIREFLDQCYHSEFEMFQKMSPFGAHLLFFTNGRGDELVLSAPLFYYKFLETAAKTKVELRGDKSYALVVLKRDTRKRQIIEL